VRAVQEPEQNEMIVEGYAIRFDEPAVFEIGGEEYGRSSIAGRLIRRICGTFR